jgi:UDP-glucuronate 4-epimerase
MPHPSIDSATDGRPWLVTGAAGFIGFHVAQRLLEAGHRVVGIDNLNDYYDPHLKRDRLAQIADRPGFTFEQADVSDRDGMRDLFAEGGFGRVIHLAAQAGVRYSLEEPYAYVDANLAGFAHVLEGCRHSDVEHLVYASSSSVYGANTTIPFSTQHNVDHPVSLYAATKKANELMAHAYSHLYGIPTTGLRFFTVYGPWGRPDMAIFRFTRAILEGQPIDVYNEGRMLRDFTYVDDVVEGVIRTAARIPEARPADSTRQPGPDASAVAPYRIYNIGNNEPVNLLDFIGVLEEAIGVKAQKNLLPMQPGDVVTTYADVDDLMADVGFRPETSIRDGVRRFVEWYRRYYGA